MKQGSELEQWPWELKEDRLQQGGGHSGTTPPASKSSAHQQTHSHSKASEIQVYSQTPRHFLFLGSASRSALWLEQELLYCNLTFLNLLMVRVVVGSCLCTQQMKGPFSQSTLILCLFCVQQHTTCCEKYQ